MDAEYRHLFPISTILGLESAYTLLAAAISTFNFVYQSEHSVHNILNETLVAPE